MAENFLSNQGLIVYPNAFYSGINLTELVNNEVLSVFDAQNKLILETQINVGNVSLENLKTGLYFLQLDGKTAKVVKQ